MTAKGKTGAVFAVLLTLLLTAVGNDLHAADSFAGQRIVELEFIGLQGLPRESLEFYLGIKPGATYDPRILNQKIHELWRRQLIEDIRIDVEPDAAGVRLRVEVRERPTLRSVDYVGLERISRTDIIDRVTKDSIRVREGDPLNPGELRRLQAVIEELYREKGFRLAQAEYRLEEVSATERRVTFTIDEGDKIRIGDLDFEGNTVFADRRLRWAMKKTKESGLLSRMLKRDVYKPAVFGEDLDNVADLYKRAGYKNVLLGEPKVEVVDMKPGAEEEKRRLHVTIPIEEGRRWRLGDVKIEGNERFPEEFLQRQFPKPRGGWLRSSALDKGLEAIGELYSNTGHLFSDVSHEIVERDEEVADVHVQVVEGDQYSVGRIEFRGNTKTRDKVLRRELGIQEGLVLNSGALRNSLLRIRQLEFFKVDENDPVEFEFNREDKTVDLTIKGEEGDRTEMQFGAGYSEIDGFFGQFSFKTRNFLGRGETLGVQFQSGDRSDLFDLSYSVPWFLDRPQSLGVQVFRRSLNWEFIDGSKIEQDTKGGTVTYGKNLGLFRSISLGYSRYDTEDFRRQPIIGQDGSIDFIEQPFSRNVSSLRLAHAFDRRDSRLEPTRGMRYSVGLEYAGGFLGGDTYFLRPRGSFSLYKPVTRDGLLTVAAFNIEAGYIKPFGGRNLFFTDRFYLGGENSMRGFRFRNISVRDEDGNILKDEFSIPLGGESLIQANLEYHFVLGGPFRAIAFVDAGNVFGEEQSIDLGRLRYSYGMELRVMVPVFGAPLRFIYARNPDPFADDRFENFQFSVGTTF